MHKHRENQKIQNRPARKGSADWRDAPEPIDPQLLFLMFLLILPMFC